VLFTKRSPYFEKLGGPSRFYGNQ